MFVIQLIFKEEKYVAMLVGGNCVGDNTGPKSKTGTKIWHFL